jgi:hypothetical protein
MQALSVLQKSILIKDMNKVKYNFSIGKDAVLNDEMSHTMHSFYSNH